MKNIELYIDENSKIIINLPSLYFKEIIWCSEVFVYIVDKDTTYLLYHNFVEFFLDSFINILIKAINKNLEVHESIKKDLGYIYNNYLQEDDELDLVYEVDEELKGIWIGSRNNVCSLGRKYKLNLSTWLFNDKNEDIILQVSYHYPWHFRDPEPDEKFIEYKEWRKSYKTFLTKVIPHETAVQWLNQVQKLNEMIEENEERLKLEYYQNTNK